MYSSLRDVPITMHLGPTIKHHLVPVIKKAKAPSGDTSETIKAELYLKMNTSQSPKSSCSAEGGRGGVDVDGVPAGPAEGGCVFGFTTSVPSARSHGSQVSPSPPTGGKGRNMSSHRNIQSVRDDA